MKNKVQRAEQLRKALQMFAQSLNDEQAMEIATVYPVYKTILVQMFGCHLQFQLYILQLD